MEIKTLKPINLTNDSLQTPHSINGNLETLRPVSQLIEDPIEFVQHNITHVILRQRQERCKDEILFTHTN